MNCGYCRKAFDEDRSQSACRQCPVGSGCGLVRCPHCGYENPGTPRWIAFLRKKLGGGERPQHPARRCGLALPMLGPRP